MKTYLAGICMTFLYALAIGANGLLHFVPDDYEGIFLCMGFACATIPLIGGFLVMRNL